MGRATNRNSRLHPTDVRLKSKGAIFSDERSWLSLLCQHRICGATARLTCFLYYWKPAYLVTFCFFGSIGTFDIMMKSAIGLSILLTWFGVEAFTSPAFRKAALGTAPTPHYVTLQKQEVRDGITFLVHSSSSLLTVLTIRRRLLR